MKKFFILIFICILGFGGYYIYTNYFKYLLPKIDVEEEKVKVEEYYIYGNHLNIKGNLKIDNLNYKKANLVFYNGDEKEIDIDIDKKSDGIYFYTSKYNNDGIYIDDLDRGKYYLFLKLEYEDKDNDKEDSIISKYYVLNNLTDYDETIYYTMSDYNNKIIINSDDEYGTFLFSVNENTDKEIYDITIDPGHGGLDSGALAGSYKESDFTMDISLALKDYLEEYGLTVKLTHDKDDIPNDVTMDEYNEHGRAVIPNEVKSKYTFSIHINTNTSSYVKGIEVYTADNINYDFAKSIANSIVKNTDYGYSTNKTYKIMDGVYTRNFTQSDINSSISEYEKKGYKAYNFSTKSNYFYMIRETGGYITGAYVDDRNPSKIGVNPYYNSNVGNESYLLELGYMSNSSDLDILLKSKKKIAKAISEAITQEVDFKKKQSVK